jgi:type I restriction enzyme S subunit
MEMMMPPLKEQEAIAEALSDADSAIESLDALIAKKRDVKQATMQQLLTGRTRLPGFTADWKEVRLGDLGSTFGGLTGKSSKDFADGNSSFVTFMNVMSNVVLNNQGTEKVTSFLMVRLRLPKKLGLALQCRMNSVVFI